jgi:predicted 3-demethylubiquinone-9 3-methyltransferase (glyoxalase superfamily)
MLHRGKEQAAGLHVDQIAPNPTDRPSDEASAVLMVSFALAGQGFLALNGGARPERRHTISCHIDLGDQAEVDRLWEALCEGGAPVQRGWVTDRYGVSWQKIPPRIVPALLRDPDRAKAERLMRTMLAMVKFDIAAWHTAYHAEPPGEPRCLAPGYPAGLLARLALPCALR